MNITFKLYESVQLYYDLFPEWRQIYQYDLRDYPLYVGFVDAYQYCWGIAKKQSDKLGLDIEFVQRKGGSVKCWAFTVRSEEQKAQVQQLLLNTTTMAKMMHGIDLVSEN